MRVPQTVSSRSKLFDKPQFSAFGRSAPLRRNLEIVDYADLVLIFWDGESHGSRFVMDTCKKKGKPHRVVRLEAH